MGRRKVLRYGTDGAALPRLGYAVHDRRMCRVIAYCPTMAYARMVIRGLNTVRALDEALRPKTKEGA